MIYQCAGSCSCVHHGTGYPEGISDHACIQGATVIAGLSKGSEVEHHAAVVRHCSSCAQDCGIHIPQAVKYAATGIQEDCRPILPVYNHRTSTTVLPWC